MIRCDPTKIAAVLRQLPARKSFTGDLDAAITQCAHQLTAVAAMAWINDQSITKPAGSKKASEEVEAVADAAFSLLERLSPEVMHKDAFFRMADQVGGQINLKRLKGSVVRLYDAAVAARYIINASPPTSAPRGRPPKKGEAAVTDAAKAVYRGITGRPWTVVTEDGKATGKCLDFLIDLFKAMDIKASPESQARRPGKEKKARARAN